MTNFFSMTNIRSRLLLKIFDWYDWGLNFERYIIIGDLNSDPKCGKLLHNQMKSSTCFKSLTGTCIDKFSLQGAGNFACGLVLTTILIYTMLKSTYSKLPPQKVFYRCYKRFSELDFLNDLYCELSNNSM